MRKHSLQRFESIRGYPLLSFLFFNRYVQYTGMLYRLARYVAYRSAHGLKSPSANGLGERMHLEIDIFRLRLLGI